MMLDEISHLRLDLSALTRQIALSGDDDEPKRKRQVSQQKTDEKLKTNARRLATIGHHDSSVTINDANGNEMDDGNMDFTTSSPVGNNNKNDKLVTITETGSLTSSIATDITPPTPGGSGTPSNLAKGSFAFVLKNTQAKAIASPATGGFTDSRPGMAVKQGVPKPLNKQTMGKPTPIQLSGSESSSFVAISNGLADSLSADSYRWQQLKTGSVPRIYTTSHEDKEKVMAWLVQNGHEFNTFTERGQRRKAYLIRGIAHGETGVNTLDIERALLAANIGGDVSISRFVTGYMKRNADRAVAPLYKLVVDHNTSDELLAGIKTIGHFAVKIEKMKPSTILQCRRCQRFGHTATMCNHAYRCVQCITAHEPGGCPRRLNADIPLGCVNCKAMGQPHDGHTANDVQVCHYYIKTNSAVIRASMAAQAGTKTDGAKIRGNQHQSTAEFSLSGGRAHGKPATRNDIFEAIRANNPALARNSAAGGAKPITPKHGGGVKVTEAKLPSATAGTSGVKTKQKHATTPAALPRATERAKKNDGDESSRPRLRKPDLRTDQTLEKRLSIIRHNDGLCRGESTTNVVTDVRDALQAIMIAFSDLLVKLQSVCP